MISSQYRLVLRELRKSAITPPAGRNRVILSSFRAIFDQAKESSRSPEVEQRFTRQVDDLIVFLKNQREHKDLLKRYSPLHDMTGDEHRAATARRVGLNMPEDVKF
ncbi:hypothetical protein BOTBODRAFT_132052 [Botryobasidium botryosum FD-172 SS1]|uniref:Complex 1 LYR protein n=1 Tax=Botryobasidium botryosum (strain FD-172 SS1) TaxID=930990 RepID=A0A067MGJ6_BOTB1|nr:hypothetical protein BOTBODRAFT_132052 [Botryobasidium botryosum FD-172 SS1]